MPGPNSFQLSGTTEAIVYSTGAEIDISMPPHLQQWLNTQAADGGTWSQAIQATQQKLKRPKLAKVDLNTEIRDVFGIRSPLKMPAADCEAYFNAQKMGGTPSYPFIDAKSLIGIEVEVENVKYMDPNLFIGPWQVVEDNSLRNNGREFKTFAIPTKYAEKSLVRLFSGLNPDVDFSPRTSIHIHQDVRAFTLKQLLTLLFTYTVCESLMFKFADVRRRHSIYCVPIVNTSMLTNFSNEKSLIHNLNTIGGWWPKYTALNLCPISSFGTVEYRHLSGTNNATKIVMWIDLISRLKVWAYRTPYEDVVRMISNLNTNSQYRSFVEQVFGQAVEILDLTNLMYDMERAVTVVRNCVITNDFHNNLLFDCNSILGGYAGLQTYKSVLTPDQCVLWEEFSKSYFPKENKQRLFITVKGALNSYKKHVGAEGAKVLDLIFGKSSEF